jgi:hypothetical protein
VRTIEETALALPFSGEGQGDRAEYLRVRGMLFRLLGNTDESRAALDESLRLLESGGRDHDIAVLRLELALLAIETRDLDAARRHLNMLRADARAWHEPGGF